MSADTTAVCGFCGDVVQIAQAVSLTIQSHMDGEASQHLFAHPACLRAHIRKDVPLITEITEEGL